MITARALPSNTSAGGTKQVIDGGADAVFGRIVVHSDQQTLAVAFELHLLSTRRDDHSSGNGFRVVCRFDDVEFANLVQTRGQRARVLRGHVLNHEHRDGQVPREASAGRS